MRRDHCALTGRARRTGNRSMTSGLPPKRGLYDPVTERDSCGIGFVANIKGVRSHQIVLDASQVLCAMHHRGGCGCEPNTGDGSGILTRAAARFSEPGGAVGFQERARRRRANSVQASSFSRRLKRRGGCKREVERIIAEEGQRLLGWRKVPTQTPARRPRRDGAARQPAHRAVGYRGRRQPRRARRSSGKLYLIRKRASNQLRRDESLAQARCSTSARCRRRSLSTRAC